MRLQNLRRKCVISYYRLVERTIDSFGVTLEKTAQIQNTVQMFKVLIKSLNGCYDEKSTFYFHFANQQRNPPKKVVRVSFQKQLLKTFIKKIFQLFYSSEPSWSSVVLVSSICQLAFHQTNEIFFYRMSSSITGTSLLYSNMK